MIEIDSMYQNPLTFSLSLSLERKLGSVEVTWMLKIIENLKKEERNTINRIFLPRSEFLKKESNVESHISSSFQVLVKDELLFTRERAWLKRYYFVSHRYENIWQRIKRDK